MRSRFIFFWHTTRQPVSLAWAWGGVCVAYLFRLLGFTKRLADQVEILLVKLGLLLSFLASLALPAPSLLGGVLSVLLIVLILDNEAFADLTRKHRLETNAMG